MKNKRQLLPQNFKITDWESLQPFFEKLLETPLNNAKNLENFLHQRSELDSVLEEDFAWRYIRMNGDTKDKNLADKFEFFVQNIQPHLSVYSDKLNKKIIQSDFFEKLPDHPYKTYKRNLKTSVEIFREKNIPLFTQLETKTQAYGKISGDMMIEWDGENLTLQQARLKLKSTDRDLREKIYKKIVERTAKDQKKLDQLLDELMVLREKIAENAGFKNFRDYKFVSMGRFDYGVEDCRKFHDAIEQEIMPLVQKIHAKRAKSLGLKKLKPWDLSVDPQNLPALKPFADTTELLAKTKKCFGKLDPFFEKCIETMDELGHFDLESRSGKAPGGFNYPLYECGIPFIFMNSVGSHRDLETMVHEGGHAIHAFCVHDIPLVDLQSTPSEVAELASMSMELISSAHWDEFYDEADLKRAMEEKLEEVILTLPWVALVDKFQHWLYENKNHTAEDRANTWQDYAKKFGSDWIDFSGFEKARAYQWQQQLHIYEVPFYYIEYGMSQLGAIGIWRNFLQDRDKGLNQYKAFMKLGYTKTIPEIYETAGVKFDFSKKYIRELMSFVEEQF